METQHVVILGATGSIGLNTLDVIERHPSRFSVLALTANRSVDSLFTQCQRFEPPYAVMVDEESAAQLQDKVQQAQLNTEVLAGKEALNHVAQLAQATTVVAGIVGGAGLIPTLKAVQASKRVLLANKEALVMAGALFMEEVKAHKAVLLPLDSEHNALFQCMPEGYRPGVRPKGVRKVILTASGGPFIHTSLDDLKTVTPEQAVAHPNWKMGAKISVDSATLANKGLEVIEASWLFALNLDEIDVVVHPQSVIHSMVEYLDGSVLAQLGTPDMRTPIAHTLAWPERVQSGSPKLDFLKLGALEFLSPDEARFPCLRLAKECLKAKNGASAVFNASNEVAVEAFLNKQLEFLQIPHLIETALEHFGSEYATSIEKVVELDQKVRKNVLQWVKTL